MVDDSKMDDSLEDLMDFGVETEYRYEPPSGWSPHPALLPPPKKAVEMDLWEAAAESKFQRVEFLAKETPKSVHERDVNGYTALAYAIRSDCIEAVEALIAAGSRLDTRDPLSGDTPLTSAVGNNSTEIVRVLVDEGADVDAIRELGKWSPLQLASANGNVEAIKILVEGGANLAPGRKGGGTALFEAALAVQEDAVKFLVAIGAPLGEAVDQRRFRKRIREALTAAVA